MSRRLLIAAALGALAAATSASPGVAAKTCKSGEVKVGSNCLRQTVRDGDGRINIVSRVIPGQGRTKVARVQLTQPARVLCAPGQEPPRETQVLFGEFQIRGRSFTGRTVSGATSREIAGGYSASGRKATIRSFVMRLDFGNGNVCTAQARNITIG